MVLTFYGLRETEQRSTFMFANAVSFVDGQVVVMEGNPESGKQWWYVPGTSSALAAAHACSNSLSAGEGEPGM